MRKSTKVILFGVVPTLLISAVIFNGIYFGVYWNSDKPFSLFLTDIDPKNMGMAEWLADFNYFYKFVRDNYPYLALKERTHGYNWLDLKDYYLTRLESVSSNAGFLAVLYDAVKALQNLHTHIVYPGDIEYFRDFFANLGFDYYPYNLIFTEEVQEANNYWVPLYYTLASQREGLMFDALILYDRGDYVIHDGFSNWVLLYGNGSKVIAVNGEPIDELISSLYERAYINWDYHRAKPYVQIITPSLFEDAIFTIRNTTGFEKDVQFKINYYSYINPWNYPSSLLSTTLLNDNKTAYIYCGSFMPENQTSDIEKLLTFYETISDCEELLIDIRGNGGGYTSYGLYNFFAYLAQDPAFLELYFAFRTGEYVQYFREGNYVNRTASKDAFVYLPPEVLTNNFQLYNYSWIFAPYPENFKFNGTIKLLVDSNVYSAAEFFTVFCKQTNFATIYGSATGGDGIGVTPMYYVLPNSKLVIRLSCCMGINAFGYANEEVRTEPDFFYESSFGNWSELIDYASKH